MSNPSPTDFWYAVSQTRILVMPSRRLETFGATLLHYHLISELMDTAGQIRIREGRITSQRPQIITPTAYATEILEGFGPEAGRYADWLREHAQDLRMIQYGFKIRKEEIQQHIVTDSLSTVMERVEKAVRAKEDPLAAVVVGVDEPWEVCLLKLMVDVSGGSFRGNVRDLERRRMFDLNPGVPSSIREEIEIAFSEAGRDHSKIKELGAKLQKHGVFNEYEDRFFELMKNKPAE
jgi:hypothetical protein